MIKNETVRLEPTISTLTATRSIQMAKRDSDGYRIRKSEDLKSMVACSCHFVISFFRLFAWRLFVISSFRMAFFRLFVFSLGVLAGRKDEITPGEKTK